MSNNIIDQCVAQNVPFAQYGGLRLINLRRRQVSRTFMPAVQAGQQLLLGAYQALARQIHAGRVRMHTRTEMLDLVVVNGVARGIVTRDLRNGKIERWLGDAVVLATGGYSNAFYLSTNAKGCNVTAVWRAHRRGAYFANPCYTQIHRPAFQSGEHQSKLTLMSSRCATTVALGAAPAGDTLRRHSEKERWYYPEERHPSFNLVRDIASRGRVWSMRATAAAAHLKST